ncbi:hypothetical protein NMG60_11024525 [Bertholletia excelsa]
MVANFRRSLSFPNHPSPSSSSPRTSLHVRSTSLPCRSHPLISQLKDDLRELASWGSNPGDRTSAWLCHGLSGLKAVHDYLDDILQLPQTHESLRHQGTWVEKLLEDYLRFVDVYGIFQSLILALKQEHSAAQVAVRRKDASKIALYVKDRKKLGKEIGKLVSTVRSIGNFTDHFHGADVELAGVIKDVRDVTMMVSASLLNGISAPFLAQKSSWMGLRLPKKTKRGKVEEGIEEFRRMGAESFWGFRKKGDEEVRMVLKKMHELEDCIANIETESEGVFRSLIKTRVSLLNVLT